MCSIKIVSDIATCKKIWTEIIPQESIFDHWEFRYSFHQSYHEEPYFIVAISGNDKIVGLAPLAFSNHYKKYIFFGGGDWNEQNKILSVSPEVTEKIFKNIPANSDLKYLVKQQYYDVKPYKETYFLIPGKFGFSMENFFFSMSNKGRKTVKRELRKIEELNPKVSYNEFELIEPMKSLNIARFGDTSSFIKYNGFSDSITNLSKNKVLSQYLRLISFRINEEIMGIALCSFYKGTYTYLQGGNSMMFPNLAKYLVYLLMQDAFDLKADRIDFLSDDCGWKEHWRLNKEMLYSFNDQCRQ